MKINITNILITIFVLIATIFLVAYFYSWHMNAVYGTKYDLPNLVETAKWVLGNFTAIFSSHSIFNTPIPWLQKKEGE